MSIHTSLVSVIRQAQAHTTIEAFVPGNIDANTLEGDYALSHTPESRLLALLSKTPRLRPFAAQLLDALRVELAFPRGIFAGPFRLQDGIKKSPDAERILRDTLDLGRRLRPTRTHETTVEADGAVVEVIGPRTMGSLPRGGKAVVEAIVEEIVLPTYRAFYAEWDAAHPAEVATREAADRKAKAHNRHCNKIKKALHEAFENCNYRVSQSSWAGGDHTVYLSVLPGRHKGLVGKCSGESATQWSRNGKWSGNDSVHRFTLRSTWLTRVPVDLRAVCGRLILDLGKEQAVEGGSIRPALWAHQSRGFSLEPRRGVLVLDEQGRAVALLEGDSPRAIARALSDA